MSNVITKNQARILQVFAGRITEQFSMREVAKILKKDSSLVRRATLPLIEQGFLSQVKNKQLVLNYRANHQEISYVEYLRSKDFLSKPGNKSIESFTREAISIIQEDDFVLLVFGSAVVSEKPGDIDILLIVNDVKQVESNEKILHNIARNYHSVKFDINVVCFASVYEMLASREQLNVMNEVLNKHIILHGAETFYRLLSKGRR
jgi:predicted transcriptional regulator